MDQTAGPTVPAPQASAPAVPRAGQAPGLSSDRIPGARLAHRCGVRRGRARGQRPVRLHAGRAVLRRGDPPSGVRLCGPAAAHAAAYPRRRAAWPQPDRDPDHPALAGGAVVVAAARFAALFGVDQLGRVLATITMACTPSCSAPTTWTTPRRWTCWPGPWCCWVSPRHCCGTGRGGGSATVVMSPKLASAGVPRRLTAAALLPAVMGTIMDHPCLLPFRWADIGGHGSEPWG